MKNNLFQNVKTVDVVIYALFRHLWVIYYGMEWNIAFLQRWKKFYLCGNAMVCYSLQRNEHYAVQS